MAKVIFGNHSSVLVPRQNRDRIRKFYCEVLGGKIMKADPERDFVRLSVAKALTSTPNPPATAVATKTVALPADRNACLSASASGRSDLSSSLILKLR